ncbi:uncharacterized protein LOC132613137 [Lycium barbarum]|uniref:uncharacterized protein LOC132613137 n=1 Tax=Lycium barbarum TaxID=112863 RepID=UPI00293F0803|nr:uncharacterized protein LOC132613137 [Lycium barbarum]
MESHRTAGTTRSDRAGNTGPQRIQHGMRDDEGYSTGCDDTQVEPGFKFSSCQTKAEATARGLELAKSLGAEIIEGKCDSLVVVNQTNGTFEIKDDRMRRYQEKLQVILHRFKEWALEHVPQDQNNEVDALANLRCSVE